MDNEEVSGVKFSEFPAEAPDSSDEIVGLHSGNNARFSISNLIFATRQGLASLFVPLTRRINNKALSSDISLNASDVGARANDWMPTAAQVGARPDTWTPSAQDVGAVPIASVGVAGGVPNLDEIGRVPQNQLPPYPTVPAASTSNPQMDGTASPGSTGNWADGGHVHPSDTSRVPTTRTINGYDLTADRTLTAADVGALAETGTANRAKQLSAAHYLTVTPNQWYKIFEIQLTTSTARHLLLTINNTGSRYCGIVYCYFNRNSEGVASSTRVRWLAFEGFSTSDLRVTDATENGVTTFSLYLRARATSYFYISTIRTMSRTSTVDVSEYWLSEAVSEPPSTAINAVGPAAIYDGNGNGIASTYARKDGFLWFSSVAVSAGTVQQILAITDATITADYVLARIEWADPSYITAGYTWTTGAGSFTLSGTATAATTANILLVRKGN